MNTQAGAWAIIHSPDAGSFQLARRSAQVNKPGLWNFFDGRIDAGEAPVLALARELNRPGF